MSPSHDSFVYVLSSISIPKNIQEAPSHLTKWQALIDNVIALEAIHTWTIIPQPLGKSIVGCRWVFIVKVGLDGQVDRLKACLVAKGYTQIFGLDNGDTFSPIVKIASIHFFLSMVAMNHCPCIN